MSTTPLARATTPEENSPPGAEHAATDALAVTHHWAPIITGCAGLLDSGDFSDFTIVCGERKWKVHKAIISQQSTYFKTACSGGFSETAHGQIDLSCDDEPAPDLLISYLYTGELQKIEAEDPNEAPDALLALKVHVLADKYNIAALCELSAHEFMRIAGNVPFWRDLGFWLAAVLQDTSETSSLRKMLLEFVRVSVSVRGLLNPGKSEGDREAVQSIKCALTYAPDFAIDLLGHMTRTWRPLTEVEKGAETARFRDLDKDATQWQQEIRVHCGVTSCGHWFRVANGAVRRRGTLPKVCANREEAGGTLQAMVVEHWNGVLQR